MSLTLEALKLHLCALQRMLVHPGWHAVVPCQSSIAMVYLSLETGSLDLGVDVEPAGQKVSTVRELLQVPTADMQQVMLSSIQTCANAKAFKRADMDECHLSMMKHAGMLPAVICKLRLVHISCTSQAEIMLRASPTCRCWETSAASHGIWPVHAHICMPELPCMPIWTCQGRRSTICQAQDCFQSCTSNHMLTTSVLSKVLHEQRGFTM